jgi:lysophospholipase L1-like esterase
MGNGFVDWFSRSYKGIIVALVAIMAVMMVVLAMQHVNDSKPAAGAEPGPLPTFGTSAASRPLAAFLGDSYTAGTGSSVPSKRWTSLVATAEGWREANDGAGGTGYTVTATEEGCGKPFCDNYAGRVKDVVAQSPSVVVVAGGQNDFANYQSDPAKVRANITKTFADLHEQLPNARIIAVGPSTPVAVTPQVTGLDSAVHAAADSVGATYVSLLEPNVIDPAFVLADGGHVNDDGHAAIAARVEAAL